MKSLSFVKMFYPNAAEEVGDQINRWVTETGNQIQSISLTSPTGVLMAVVLYSAQDVEEKDSPAPIIPGSADIPFVATTMLVDGEKKKSHCMAGIFGVPEGWVMGTDDIDVAPVPVFSPDFKFYDLPEGWFVLREAIGGN